MNTIILRDKQAQEKEEMRTAFMDELLSLAAQNKKITYLDADLESCIGGQRFAAQYSTRSFDCGIQEANMVGVAAGLSTEGFIPFCHSFASFITRRVCDQVFISCAYAGQNVKLIGSDPGVIAQLNGGTHMPFEDVGIMRSIPEMTVLEPTDATMIKSLLPKVADFHGCCYIRLTRKGNYAVYAQGSSFELGKAAVLREGKDVTLIASGLCVSEALAASDMLAAEGISAGVIDMFTVKPIDREAIIHAAQNSRAIVSCENHSVLNGLGSAVAEVLGENCPRPLVRVGIKDRFGQVGDLEFLKQEYEIDKASIISATKKALTLG